MNAGKEIQVGNRSFGTLWIHASAKQLEKIVQAEIIAASPLDLFKAVSTIGRNVADNGELVWIFDEDVAFDKDGKSCNMEDFQMEYVSGLIPKEIKLQDGIASHRHSVSVEKPLTQNWFDLLCHFLKG